MTVNATATAPIKSQRIGALVHARGWRYEVPENGDIKYRIFGRTPGGQAWEIYYDSEPEKLKMNSPATKRGAL